MQVAPARGRGLKLKKRALRNAGLSRPRKGAWIEIAWRAFRPRRCWRRPRKGAWIEIKQPHGIQPQLSVAPARGRGLKSPMVIGGCGGHDRRPRKGAWIEILSDQHPLLQLRRPRKGAWIEIDPGRCTEGRKEVAPVWGRGLKWNRRKNKKTCNGRSRMGAWIEILIQI